MTLTLPDLLMGQYLSLTLPMPPEAGPDYLAGRLGLIGMIAILTAQEAEHGVAARVWENRAIQDLLARTAGLYGVAVGGESGEDADLSLTALDAINAPLRMKLITLHEAAEAAGDAALTAEIIALYQAMAHRRRLQMPPS